jgi:hypothetical protein
VTYQPGDEPRSDVDRRLLQTCPQLLELARENRQFQVRAITWLAAQGIRQFLDIGSGPPRAHNTHEIAQAVAPACRVVYVDNNPVAATHARALPEGPGTAVAEGDMRDPGAILASPAVGSLIRPGEPAALIMATVLHFFDFATAREIACGFIRWLPPGSYAVISVGSGDERTRTFHNHNPQEIEAFFCGLELISPGLVDAGEWRPGTTAREPRPHEEGRVLAAVACKPR